MGRSQSIIVVSLLAALAGAGACSLTIDLDDITGGVPSVGGGGQGGVGGAEVECIGPSDCPTPSSPCEAPVCIGGDCGIVAQLAGLSLQASYQTDYDCLDQICDGAGNQVAQNDEHDHPDSTGCATYSCNSGIGVDDQQPVGEPCGTDGVCDAEGSCVECNVPGDCTHLPEDDDCQTRTCEESVCGQTFALDLTVVSLQTAGNCKETVCDGEGGTKDEPLETDEPDDGNDCTTDSCSGAQPTFTPKVNGTQCGNGLSCASGLCTGCNNNPANCPGEDTFCRLRTCVADVCGFDFINASQPLPTQQPNDCQREECDSQGNVVTVADDNDHPLADTNECTGVACSNGSAQWPPLPLDTDCNGNTEYCDGAGHCVSCNSAYQCDAQDCYDPTCIANQCGTTFTAGGQPSPTQVDYDCQVILCNGSGGTYQDDQNSDLPIDGNECTLDVCTSGAPSNPAAPLGAQCTTGGNACDGAGSCVECTVDLHCTSTYYCDSLFQCVSDEALGHACTSGSQCQSTHCVDGLCCDMLCGGQCEACAASKTDAPNGTCAFITALTDPDNDCPSSTVCYSGSCCQPGTATFAPQSLPQDDYPAIPDCPAVPRR